MIYFLLECTAQFLLKDFGLFPFIFMLFLRIWILYLFKALTAKSLNFQIQ